MWNLLGRQERQKTLVPQSASLAKTRVYWYGKSEERVGRKMGHINAWGKTSRQALLHARRAANSLGYT
jgi:phosphoribosylaminoimidazole carboxylase (NCAIR synthetase)